MADADVDALVAAYQATMAEAASLDDALERAIVVAAVVDNALAAKHRLHVATVGGDQRLERLDRYITELQTENRLGHFAAAARGKAADYGKHLAAEVRTWALTKAAPPSLLALFGLVARAAGWLHSVGASIGATLGVLVAGFAAFAMKSPGQATRIITSAAPAVGRGVTHAGQYLDESWGRATARASSVGVRSAVLLQSALVPRVRAVLDDRSARAGTAWPATLRGVVQVVFYLSAALVAVALIVVALGIADGFDDANRKAIGMRSVASIS